MVTKHQQIFQGYNFDGTGDEIRCAVGNSINFTAAGMTFMAVARHNNTSWGSIICANTSAGTSAKWSMEFDPSHNLGFSPDTGSNDTSTLALPVNNWGLVFSSKIAGSAIPRYSRYNLSLPNAGWTHQNGSAAQGDGSVPATTGMVQFGKWSTADDLAGDLAMVAVWRRVLTDSEREWFLSDDGIMLARILKSQPRAVWAFWFNRIVDITGGGSNETFRSGNVRFSQNALPRPILRPIYRAVPLAPAAGITYTETGTAVVVITPSSTDISDRVDSATATVAITPSTGEVFAAQDQVTATVAITPSGTEQISGSTTDADTAYINLEVSQIIEDSGTASVTITPSTTFEQWYPVDSDTVFVLIDVDHEVVFAGISSGTPYVDVTPSATEFTGAQGARNTMYVGPQGMLDPFVRPIVRTSNQIVYIFCSDDQDSGTQYVRAYKGDQSPIPTTFTEQDVSGRPDNSATTSAIDCMLDDNGIVHMLYQLDTGGLMYAQYNTVTDNWDLKDESVATGLNSTAGPFDRCFAAFCILLDHNNKPHCVYGSGGTVSYRDRTAGTWSSATTVGTSQGAPKDFQGVCDSVGDFHVSWLTNPFTGTPAIKYAKRQSGTWQSVETVEGTGVLASTANDQGPSISLDHLERPLILFLNTSDVMKVYRRDSAGTYTSLNASLQDSHAPAIYSQGRQIYLLEGHGIGGAADTKSAMQFSTDAGTTWSAEVQLWFGAEDTDGTAAARYDPWRNYNNTIIDAVFWDEDYGGTGAPFVGRILYIALTPRAEEDTILVDVTPSGVEGPSVQFTDSGTATVAITPSGTDAIQKEYTETGTPYVDLQVSSVEVTETIDSGSTYVDVTPSATEARTSDDTGAIYMDLNTSGTDVYASVSSGTTYVTLTPTGNETFGGQGSDVGEVYVNIQSFTYLEYIIPKDSLLVGTLRRHYSGTATKHYGGTMEVRKFGATVGVRHWGGALMAARKWKGTLGTRKWQLGPVIKRYLAIYRGRGEL